MNVIQPRCNSAMGAVVWSAAEGHADGRQPCAPEASARRAPGVAFASRLRPRHPCQVPRAFSLIEVLLAIMILGIGVISIAALFPAGIAQQRLSGDDVMGPTVANHAISIIRSKVQPEDFGTFEEFWPYSVVVDPVAGDMTRTMRGDWGWMRPSLLIDDHPPTAFDERGSIDIFSYLRSGQAKGIAGFPPAGFRIGSEHFVGWPEDVGIADRWLFGIPYNTNREFPPPLPPRIIISQTERYYPMRSQLLQPGADGVDPARPQYVWDCMFRRFQGRIYVAVFVYRVSTPGAPSAQTYIVPPKPGGGTNWQIPPLPVSIDMTPGGSPGWPTGPWDIAYDSSTGRALPEVRGFPQGAFDPLAEDQGWQMPRQWILDQNNNVHRVMANRRPTAADGGNQMVIELARPLAPVKIAFAGTGLYGDGVNTIPAWPTFAPDEYFGDPSLGPINPALTDIDTWFPNFDRGVVTRFWYIPLRVESAETGAEYTLTPVYLTVKEL